MLPNPRRDRCRCTITFKDIYGVNFVVEFISVWVPIRCVVAKCLHAIHTSYTNNLYPLSFNSGYPILSVSLPTVYFGQL